MAAETTTGPVAINLSGKVVLVTGGGSSDLPLLGIGAATALYAARAGANVAIVDRDRSSNERTLARWEEEVTRENARGRMIALEADVSDPDACQGVAESTVESFGPIDGLVNNVGTAGPRGTALDVDLDGWEQAMGANVLSMVLMTRVAIANMEGGGSIVNMSSIAGIRGGHHALSYPTTKAAVLGLTRTMAAHHGPAGIRVNALVPGLVYTPMVAARGLSEEGRRTRTQAAMLQREGLGWDVAAAAAFLLSDASSWITAQTLAVDGGLGEYAANLGVTKAATPETEESR